MYPTAHYALLHFDRGTPAKISGNSVPIGHPEAVQITNDIRIERLNSELANKIVAACEPPSLLESHIRDRHLYAWIREVPNKGEATNDGLNPLAGAVALSRLVRPTTTGFRYLVFLSGQLSQPHGIRALRFTGVSPDVLLGPPSEPDWLSDADITEVKRLMVWLHKPMPQRIHRAYWNHEYALHLFELDIRWQLIVGGFEALVKTSNNHSTHQFTSRVERLAVYFDVPLEKDVLEKAYEIRSSLAHGEHFLHGLTATLPNNEQYKLYENLESLLRKTIKECLLNESFLAHFTSKENFHALWSLRSIPKVSG